MIKHIFSLTKPGIIFGNLLTASAGFWFGFHILYLEINSHILWLFVFTMLGIALVIASGCSFNNYIDCDIDALMERTKNRVLVTGVLKRWVSIAVGIVCLLLGAAVLFLLVNFLCAAITVIGFIFYVGCYSLYFKRNSVYGTLIGGISGAIPPLSGMCAITNSVNIPSVVLFIMLLLWQIPHFYAIAIYRHDDYKNALIPVLPVISSMDKVLVYIRGCILLFVAFGILLWIVGYLSFGYSNFIYLLILMVFGVYWIRVAYITQHDISLWARKVFRVSLLVITFISIALIF